jgi:hypothetical protein
MKTRKIPDLKTADAQRKAIIRTLETSVEMLRSVTPQQYVEFYENTMLMHYHVRRMYGCISDMDKHKSMESLGKSEADRC